MKMELDYEKPDISFGEIMYMISPKEISDPELVLGAPRFSNGDCPMRKGGGCDFGLGTWNSGF